MLRHDLLADPVAELGTFDLIHTRYLLMHLTGRQEEAVTRLVSCLKPGG